MPRQLREARCAHQPYISLRDMALFLGIRASAYSAIETGRVKPTEAQRRRIEQILGEPFEDPPPPKCGLSWALACPGSRIVFTETRFDETRQEYVTDRFDEAEADRRHAAGVLWISGRKGI